MIEALIFLLPAFLVAVCLVGIHVYFGIQVLARQVNKDDLARQHLDAEIDVDADQANRNQECRKKKT